MYRKSLFAVRKETTANNGYSEAGLTRLNLQVNTLYQDIADKAKEAEEGRRGVEE